jgi:hypothetical protein
MREILTLRKDEPLQIQVPRKEETLTLAFPSSSSTSSSSSSSSSSSYTQQQQLEHNTLLDHGTLPLRQLDVKAC